ncbi:MAG TPA: UvrD-helicase domain-containing protein [Terriglobia bacterium]|nr:UvrD-helicase domain-containing protein [Terriglobia bacterium]
MKSLLEQLNAQQRAAVEHTDGPLLILAGAGSGKTRVITYRIAYLIEACGVPPENILAVTFTNKAADQMKYRVAALLEGRVDRLPHISTFHSFCVSVLRRHIERLGYTRDFTIYDEDDQQRAIKIAGRELSLSDWITSPRSVLARISAAKNRGVSPETMLDEAHDPSTRNLAAIFERYESKLGQSNALDFDDLLLKTVALFDDAPDVAEQYNRRFRYIMVDEYQDTNRIQYQLIRQLTRAQQNICAVGDEDQSIYRWRGADIENILNFDQDYPGTAIIRLEQNYRSTQMILDAATAVVSHNVARKGKSLRTDRGAGLRVGLYEARNADEEGWFVSSEIMKALGEESVESVGVLFRTNAQSRTLEEALRRNRIMYRVVGGTSFYDRSEIKDALAYARLSNNLRDSSAMQRIINTPPRGIGDTTVDQLQALAAARDLTLWEALEQAVAESPMPVLDGPSEQLPLEQVNPFSTQARKALRGFHSLMTGLSADRETHSLSEFFRAILDHTHYIETLDAENTPAAESRIENLRELVNAAAEAEERGERLSDFLDHAALVSDADSYDERARVTLMTLHSAKGLEFSVVFLAGMEEGLFPHKLSGDDDAGLEEERRLCYVGMTRARDRLLLTWVRERRFYGRQSQEGTMPSRFLSEIPQQLIEPLNVTMFPSKPRTTWGNAVNSADGIERFFSQRGHEVRASRAEPAIPHSRPATPARWRQGSKVRHPKYGIGTVLDSEGEGDNTKVTVSFPGYGRKKLVERYASLEKI